MGVWRDGKVVKEKKEKMKQSGICGGVAILARQDTVAVGHFKEFFINFWKR